MLRCRCHRRFTLGGLRRRHSLTSLIYIYYICLYHMYVYNICGIPAGCYVCVFKFTFLLHIYGLWVVVTNGREGAEAK